MNHSRLALAAILALMTAGCGMSGGGAPKPEPAPAPFINRVWQVVDAADIARGTYYVFVSDNTLLVTAPGATKPSLGRWHFAGGGIVLIEEGFRYPADILEQGDDRFLIRVHRSGGPVDVRMTAVNR